MNETTKVFRWSSSKMIFFTVPLAWIFGAAIVFVQQGFKVPWGDLVVGLAAGMVVCVVLSWIACRFYTTEVSSAGLRAHSFWGARRFIRWDEIKMVRPFSVLSLRYLTLYSQQSSQAIWLGLFFPNYAEFKQAVTESANRDNPILAHL